MKRKIFLIIAILAIFVAACVKEDRIDREGSTPTPTPIQNKGKCEVEPDEADKCPVGCVNYGVPLGCVTPEYYEECKSSGKPCPICLAENTFIDTPSGTIAVQDLEMGAEVWTLNTLGTRVPARILKTVRTLVPSDHRVIHLILDDGRELFVSPGHPIRDGRIVGALSIGDPLSGGRIMSAERVLYRKDYTYDILPSGETGFYWANGVLLGSTLS